MGFFSAQKFTAAIILACAVSAAAEADTQPLSIARQGHLFAGGHYASVDGRALMSGQIYAEFQIPKDRTHAYPIVLVHGAGQTGTNFTGTPDGREGWAQYFLRRGYAVYVVDQAGRGRSAYRPEIYGALSFPDPANIQRRFTEPAKHNLWPQAHLHTQWPGGGVQGDPVFDQFIASQVPTVRSAELMQTVNRDALIALLEKIGPSILLTHSQSGSYGFPVADTRPDLVKALIEVEPSGPPVYDTMLLGAPDYFRDGVVERSWGLSAVPLRYEPAVQSADELSFVRQDKADGPGLARCWAQASPARQLPNLQKMPVLIVHGEASYHAPYEHCTVNYLRQAGVKAAWLDLGRAGIRGNGHMMMLEKNSDVIADAMADWLESSLTNPAASQ